MPRFELLELTSTPSNVISFDRNYIGPSITFSGGNIAFIFSIGKNKFLPDSLLEFSFDYTTDAPFSTFSPYITLDLNGFSIGGRTFTSISETKNLSFTIESDFLSILNNSITDINYDLLTVSLGTSTGSSSTSTSLSNITLSWSISKTEELENFETFEGNDANTYQTYEVFPSIFNLKPITKNTSGPSNAISKYYKANFSGIQNDPFDLVSRAVLRVTGSNNNSISGISENPCKIEAYCVNKNISDTVKTYETQDGDLNQEGDVFVWGVSDLIAYSGTQSNDIEMCFVKENNSHPFSFPAKKYSRDHKSLFAEGDLYLKGLTSGYEIDNIELILYEDNNKYLSFSMFGGDTNFSDRIVTIVPEGYVSSRKLMTKNLQFWNCSGIYSGTDPEADPYGLC